MSVSGFDTGDFEEVPFDYQPKPRRRRRKTPRIAFPDAGVQREAAGWAMGLLVQAASLPPRRFKSMFEDIEFDKLGLDIEDALGMDDSEFRSAVREQARRKWKNLIDEGSPLLARNLAKLSDLLALDRAERWMLRVFAHIPHFRPLQNVAGACCDDDSALLARILAQASGMGIEMFRKDLRSDRNRLWQLGLLQRSLCGGGVGEVAEPLHEELLHADFDPVSTLRGIVRESAPVTLARIDFPHLEQDTQLLLPWLGHALDTNKPGCNVLIHGEPGVGKTEYSRWLAQELSASLLEVPLEDNDGDPIEGRARFTRLSLCQRIAAKRGATLVLFDEMEDAFGHSKAWTNEQLERNPVPTIWLCNYARHMDPAHLRRFDFIVEMRTPPRSQRLRIAREAFASAPVPETCIEAIAAHEDLTPAHVARIAGVVATLPARDAHERVQAVHRLAAGRLEVRGLSWNPNRDATPEHYRPDLINADVNLAVLVERLRRQPQARLCLDGPPGTGKSAFARHLAQQLDRPLLCRRGSDLRSKYIGETERNLATAFRDAESEGAVLVIDEADGFLGNRNNAIRSWEVNEVNELLQQMEQFRGVFVATTNRMDALDPAALRRFDHKLRFGWLRQDQRAGLLIDLARDLGLGEHALTPELRRVLDKLDHLAPGDFAVLRRQVEGNGASPSAADLIESLRREMSFKREGRARPMGFLQ